MTTDREKVKKFYITYMLLFKKQANKNWGNLQRKEIYGDDNSRGDNLKKFKTTTWWTTKNKTKDFCV